MRKKILSDVLGKVKLILYRLLRVCTRYLSRAPALKVHSSRLEVVPMKASSKTWIALTTGVFLTSSAYGQLANTDQPFPGQLWMVACQNLPVHAADTGYSRTVGSLQYKDHVKIAALSKQYELPDSQTDNENQAMFDTGGDSAFDVASEVKYFAWARITGPNGQKGFVPMSCLINGNLVNGPHEDPSVLGRQVVRLSETYKETVSSRGMKAGNTVPECTNEMIENRASETVSSRGFSKKEKGDRVAMRGIGKMTADGVCVREDYAGLRAHINETPLVVDSYNEDLAFRKQGRLGEFK